MDTDMDFLQLTGKKIVIFGLANKKSVACAIGRVLVEAGAEVIHVVRSDERAKTARRLFPDSPVFTCDVEEEANIISVRDQIAELGDAPLAGLVHSIAFANYSHGFGPFHETDKKDFLQALARAVWYSRFETSVLFGLGNIVRRCNIPEYF